MQNCEICGEMFAGEQKSFGRHVWAAHRVTPSGHRMQHLWLPLKCARLGWEESVAQLSRGGWSKNCYHWPHCVDIVLLIVLLLAMIAGWGCRPSNEAQADLSQLTLEELEQAVLEGGADAMAELAQRYHFGRNVMPDQARAAELFRAAAERGHVDSMYNLGVMHQHGQGIPLDERESFRLYLQAAERGHVEATKYVALMYKLGVGVERNYLEAMRWFRRSAELGNTAAYSSIAHMYYEGLGVPQDYRQAREWYLKAAEAGDANAYAPLAMIYSSGRGVPRDEAEAMKWMHKADAAGIGGQIVESFLGDLAARDPDSLYEMGVYFEQQGKLDQARDVMWRASDAGSARARQWLRQRGEVP